MSAATFFAPGDTGISVLNTALAQEAFRMNKDIYRRTLHTSPWLTLTKQAKFQDGMGHTQTTLIYDRALPTTDVAGNSRGVTWHPLASLQTTQVLNTSQTPGAQPLVGATDKTVGPSGNMVPANVRSFLNLSRKLKAYALKRAIIESPKISLEDLRFAAYRDEQIRAITELMSEATRYTWEERYRDEYDVVADNFVAFKTSGTAIASNNEGNAATDIVVGNGAVPDINANLSNAVLDKLYQRLIRQGAGPRAWGQENGRPIFVLVLSSEASYGLQTEAQFRDDVRYNNARVSELIAPLGVEKSFRGFYHLVDDLAPRFTYDEASEKLVRVDPYLVTAGVVSDNPAYDEAPYEAAFLLHQDVMESQIPDPLSGSGKIKFEPLTFRGDFRWTNIPDADHNPDGTIGFFRGVLASATKAIKTEFGYVLVFDRTASVRGA